MDLRPPRQPPFDRPGDRSGIPESAVRSARSVPEIQDASVPETHSRRWKAGALRREDDSLWRLVRDAANLCGRRADHRRLRELSRFAAPQGHSHGHEERDAGRRNYFRGVARGRLFLENARGLSEKSRAELDQKRTLAGAQFPSIISTRFSWRNVSRGLAIHFRRARPD